MAGLVLSTAVGLSYLLTVLGWSVSQAQGRPLTIAMIPKVVGIDYFNATRVGAEQAVRELGGIRYPPRPHRGAGGPADRAHRRLSSLHGWTSLP